MNIMTPAPAASLRAEFQRHVVRHVNKTFDWDAFPSNWGFPDLERAQMRYIGPGGVESDTCRKEMPGVPPGVGVKPYVRDVEDAFLVLEGSLTVGWEEDGRQVETELGPRDLVFNPAGRSHWFRNNSAGPCTVWSVIGTEQPETVIPGAVDTDSLGGRHGRARAMRVPAICASPVGAWMAGTPEAGARP